MQAAETAQPRPRRLARAEIGSKKPQVCETAEALRKAMGEACVRTVWLQGLSSTEVRGRLSSFRSQELAMLKGGNITQFGSNRLMNLVEVLGCKLYAEVIPAPVPSRAPDERLSLLFRALSETDDACQAAVDDIGPRSHPLARVAVRHAGIQCALAVDAIRRAPEFWHREAHAFSALLFSAEQMLETIAAGGSSRVSKALRLLRETAEMLEELADERLERDRSA